jgi:hypothetical protein
LWALPEHINYFSSANLRALFASNDLSFERFGLQVLRSGADMKFIPRALFEMVGLAPFGHNVFGTRK